jgi:ABC-type nitrate/sulfonate/bicarbonate transport system substrate-binding protein/predicted transcriptional regulator
MVGVHTMRFWRLDGDDRPAVDRLAVGLGRKPAQVLAFLALRADREDDPATGREIRIGTDLNRKAVSAALERLETRGLLATTTLSDDSRGRPPKAWHPVAGLDELARRTYDAHAATLLKHSDALHRGVDAPDGDAAGADATDFDAPDGTRDDRESDGPKCDRETRTEQDAAVGLVLALNWRSNGLHVPFYAAERAGHYEDRGVAVQFEHENGSRRAVERVVSGEADVGLAGAGTVVRAREAGEPVRPLAVIYQRAMTVFYTVRETFGEPLERVEQFCDRRIGMPTHSETGLLGRLFLSQVDVDERVEFVETAGEERETLVSGDADIVTGSFADPRELEARGFTVDVLPVADRFPIYGLVLVAHPDAFDSRRGALRRFLAGTVHGWSRARRRPDAAVEAIAEDGSSPTRVERTFRRAAEEFGDSDAVRERGWGWQHTDTWNRLRTALAQGELLRGDA